ncbi:unnamed protein product [Allacma fusca]|uniref:Uncharacterized protein n=1 Tax=Allacma fusca TaxID=39272 RepID=A0A8J2K665_9HEXA|nr:unnamed protein product [Allacma fusca]
MLKIALTLLLATTALAQLRSPYADIVNYRSENQNDGAGNYNYLWENSDGTLAQERGYQKPPNPGQRDNNNIQVAEGSYQYFSPEGQLIRVTYIADENGFQPSGDHLPTPPPIPEAIQKALDIIYAGIARKKTAAELAAGNYNGQYTI